MTELSIRHRYQRGKAMAKKKRNVVPANVSTGVPIFELWDKYEQVAMHFNDLILKIRVQALAAVAAIATIVGVLSRSGQGGDFNWGLTMGVFFFLIIFWVAVWILDFRYYNRLLHGAVDAILELEKESKNINYVQEINLSTFIEHAVAGRGKKRDKDLHRELTFGRRWYYQTVLFGLTFGFLLSAYKYFCA
jgi:hypothetical protein